MNNGASKQNYNITDLWIRMKEWSSIDLFLIHCICKLANNYIIQWKSPTHIQSLQHNHFGHLTPTPNLPSFPRGSKHSPSHQKFNTEIHRINFNVLHALSSLSRCDDIDNNFWKVPVLSWSPLCGASFCMEWCLMLDPLHTVNLFQTLPFLFKSHKETLSIL